MSTSSEARVRESTVSKNLSADEIYHEMEVLEPSTAGKLASHFDVPKDRVRKLLQRFSTSRKLRDEKRDVLNRAMDIAEEADVPVSGTIRIGYHAAAIITPGEVLVLPGESVVEALVALISECE